MININTASPSQIAGFVHSLSGEPLNEAIRIVFEKAAVNPAGDFHEAWNIASKHNTEAWHKFNLWCDCELWSCEFSGLFRAYYCESPQVAILQALLLDHFSITQTVDDETKELVFYKTD